MLIDCMHCFSPYSAEECYDLAKKIKSTIEQLQAVSFTFVNILGSEYSHGILL